VNLPIKQPLKTDGCAEVHIAGQHPGAHIARAVENGTMPETQKQRVRRLAAHCQKYRGSLPKVALRQLITTLALLAVTLGVMFATVDSAYWATLILAVPAAGFLVRAFIIQHDCGHGSFFSSRLANDWVGRLMSVLTLAPYTVWRREHAYHHATSGNLDRRGAGDIKTLTVREYLQLPRLQKLRYQIYRNPIFLFGIGVPVYFIILQRLPWFHALPARETWRSVAALNAGLVLFYLPLVYWFGISHVLWVGLPVLHIASAVGGWMFFVQHQFEETTWEQAEGWDFQVAALLGSSYYQLPRLLNWFTGNIGLHHIHHLSSMIPNYRLHDCLAASPELKSINRLTLRDSLKCTRLKLWDETHRRLIAFSELPAPA
jgi:omega-6 fatty acid desaturase (delta-12 desaturase)